MWIPELNRELHGRPLAIWLGRNPDGSPIEIPAGLRERYMARWRRPAVTAAASPPARRRPCVHLGPVVRVAGSNRTWHECGAGHGVVCPCGTFGGNPHGCKRCPDYDPSS